MGQSVPQSAHLWWPVMAKLQAASVRDRQTDGSRYSKMPLGRGSNNMSVSTTEISVRPTFAKHALQ